MTPREVIIRNLNFSDPERIGMEFDGKRINDFCVVGLSASPNWKQRRWFKKGFEYFDDEWGNTWFRVQNKSTLGEIFRPALSDWSMLKDLKLPDLTAPERYTRAAAEFGAAADLYRLAFFPGFPFSICRYLRKMEDYLQDIILEREHVDELHQKVTCLLESVLKQFARCGADGIFFCEDWGTQERLLVSPRLWREVYKPLFRRLCDAAHREGLQVLMHSCGYIWEILDDLAEVGINAVQLDQPHLYGLERLAAKLQDLRLCLFAPVDIQKILPTGDKRLIQEQARQMVKLFSGKQGGFIARNYTDLKGVGVQPEWDQWAYEVFLSETGKK